MHLTIKALEAIKEKYFNHLPKEKESLIKELEQKAFNLIYKIIYNIHHIAGDNIHCLIEDMQLRGFNSSRKLYGFKSLMPALLFIYILSPESLSSEEISIIETLSIETISEFRIYLELNNSDNFNRFLVHLNEINTSLRIAYSSVIEATQEPQTILDNFSSSLEQILGSVLPHHTIFDQRIRTATEEVVRKLVPSSTSNRVINSLTSQLINQIEDVKEISQQSVEEKLPLLNPLTTLNSIILKSRSNKEHSIKKMIIKFIKNNYSDTSEDNGLITFNDILTLSFEEVTQILYDYFTSSSSSSHIMNGNYSSEDINMVINFFREPFLTLNDIIHNINDEREEEIQELNSSNTRPIEGSIDWLIESSYESSITISTTNSSLSLLDSLSYVQHASNISSSSSLGSLAPFGTPEIINDTHLLTNTGGGFFGDMSNI